MSDPFSVEPPAWFQRLSTQGDPSKSLASLAGTVGRIGGAALNATEQPEAYQSGKTPGYYQRFRTNLAESYKTEQDPLWKLKEMRLKTEISNLGLQAESFGFKNRMQQQQSLMQAESLKELAQLQTQAIEKGNPLLVEYSGVNPFTQKAWSAARLDASRGLVAKQMASDKTQINALIAKLPLEKRAIAMSMPRDDNGYPSPATWDYITRSAAEAEKTQASKPLHPIGRLLHDREQVAAAGGDTSMFDKELAKEGGELMFEDIDIGGKKFTSVRQEGKGGFRLIPHEGNDKLTIMKFQEASRQKRDALKALSDFKRTLEPAQKQAAQDALEAAQKIIDESEARLSSPGAMESKAKETPAQSQEVIRIDKNGKRVVFDAVTKKPLRYAD